jgi:hypothetical protein
VAMFFVPAMLCWRGRPVTRCDASIWEEHSETASSGVASDMTESESWRLLPYDVGRAGAMSRWATLWCVWFAGQQSGGMPPISPRWCWARQTLSDVDLPACDEAGVLVVKRQAGGTRCTPRAASWDSMWHCRRATR